MLLNICYCLICFEFVLFWCFHFRNQESHKIRSIHESVILFTHPSLFASFYMFLKLNKIPTTHFTKHRQLFTSFSIKRSIHLKKSYGQHLLVDKNILRKIIQSCNAYQSAYCLYWLSRSKNQMWFSKLAQELEIWPISWSKQDLKLYVWLYKAIL